MEVHFLPLVLKYQDSSQEQASSSQQRHLFLSPTPTHTRGTAPTTPWEGTKFPPYDHTGHRPPSLGAASHGVRNP